MIEKINSASKEREKNGSFFPSHDLAKGLSKDDFLNKKNKRENQ